MTRTGPKGQLHACLLLAGAVIVAVRVDARAAQAADPGLVRVTIVKTSTDKAEQTVVIGGHQIQGYRPTLIETFPATGVVIDDAGHVLTFLGYRWPDLCGGDLRVEIFAPGNEQKLRGRLLGIDQS